MFFNFQGQLLLSSFFVNENTLRKFGEFMISEKWQINKDYKNISIAILQDNLSALRAKAGINQEELANIIGISRQTYYAYETKKQTMNWNTFMATIFFFHKINSTSTMLNELKVYPIDLFDRFNKS